ncbi:MAG: hypothetical protein WB791_00920, partial [Waddliaceae bacterium]
HVAGGDFNKFLILSGLQNRSLVCSHQSRFCNPLRIKKMKKSPVQHAECGIYTRVVWKPAATGDFECINFFCKDSPEKDRCSKSFAAA